MPWLRRFFKKILRVREMDLSINKSNNSSLKNGLA